MKNLRFHLIYLVLIGFLTYQYWKKTQALAAAVGSIDMFDKVLKINSEVVEKASMMIQNEINKQVNSFPNSVNVSYLAFAQNMMKVTSDVKFLFEKQKKEFIVLSGDFEKKGNSALVNRLSSKTSGQFFSEQKINEIREYLTRFERQLNYSINNNNNPSLRESYIIPKLLKNEAYWKTLKDKTSIVAVAQLTLLQNQIELDKVPYLNEILAQIGGSVIICGPTERVAIAPKKAALFQDEVFEADIYLAQYASIMSNDITFIVNNEELSLKDGVAHFATKDKTVGKKTVKVEARIRNPLTGQIISQFGEFEYEVLPKCAKNCQ